MLEHADRRDLVVRAGHVTEVGDVRRDARLEAERFRAGERLPDLVRRRRDAVGADTVVLRRVDDQPAPPAADVQHPIALTQLELLTHAVVLVLLQRLQRVVGRLLIAAAVPHRLVEEQLVDVGADVVVRLDPPRGIDQGVTGAHRDDACQQTRIAPNQPIDVRHGERRDEAIEPAALHRPAAFHVGLAHPEIAGRQDAAREPWIGDADDEFGIAPALADVVGTVRQDESDARLREEPRRRRRKEYRRPMRQGRVSRR